MTIADQLRKTNRAEYLLYMWQVEDLLRAYGLDADRVAAEYLCRFELTDERRAKTEQWYADLCRRMQQEGLREKGHLQIVRQVLQQLEELHARLLNSPRFPYYREMYYRVLPYIVELRAKQKPAPSEAESELSTCFGLLYGVLMLRLQHKPVSAETEKAVKDISTLLGQLSDYYFKDKQEPIEF